MVNELQHKWALILGGSSGLGFASAVKLAKSGMNCVIIHRDPGFMTDIIEERKKALNEIGGKHFWFSMDATHEQKVNEFLEKWDKNIIFSLVLHSIAKGHVKSLMEPNTLDWRDMQLTSDAMSLSLWLWCKPLKSLKLLARPCRIIAFSSEGSLHVLPNYAAVAMAKASVEKLIQHIAVEWFHEGISANSIRVGATQTPATERIPGWNTFAEKTIKRNPGRRMTLPEDAANAVYLLMLPEAQWINGSTITVDGGESLQMV